MFPFLSLYVTWVTWPLGLCLATKKIDQDRTNLFILAIFTVKSKSFRSHLVELSMWVRKGKKSTCCTPVWIA